jgi:hypothetical protein
MRHECRKSLQKDKEMLKTEGQHRNKRQKHKRDYSFPNSDEKQGG